MSEQTNEQDGRGPRERAYDEKVSPLMGQIIALCKEHGIPMVATFELDLEPDHAEDDPMLCTTILIDRPGGPLAPRSPRMVEAARAMRPAPAFFAAFVVREGSR